MSIRLSMRWWLALAFAAVAALTAFSVTEVFTHRAERALRDRATALAAGETVAAAEAIRSTIGSESFLAAVASEARARRLALFVMDPDGRLLTPANSRGVRMADVDSAREGLTTALRGRRYLRSLDGGERIVVALPLRGGRDGAVLAVASQPDLTAAIGIVRDEIVIAAFVAVIVGVIAGLVVAALIALRLGRIARTAKAIEEGSFDTDLKPRFGDEVGQLAATVDSMRIRLRQSMQSLEAERNRLRLLLERLGEGIIAVDSELNVVIVNEVAGEMLETWSLSEGDPLPDYAPELRLRSFAQSLFTSGAEQAQARFTLDGVRTYTVVGIPPPAGSSVAVLVLTDVSERERRERAEREFVANAAHELRTPLTALASAVESLQAGASEEAATRTRLLAVIERQTSRLGRLTRALLILARAQTRQETIHMESVRLRPLLEAAASGLTPEVAVEIDCLPTLTVWGEADLLEQVVANLAGNAAKHADGGAIVLAARQTGHHVEIEVTDDGPGISAADQARVFDRFYSLDRESGESFGLGLAIVREAVRVLGGRIEIDSAPGNGTTVRVRLAAADSVAA
jgi:signal transduction histidine kinase